MHIDLSSDFVRFTLTRDEELAALLSSEHLLPYVKSKLSVYAESAMAALMETTKDSSLDKRETALIAVAKVEVLRELCDEIARARSDRMEGQKDAPSATSGSDA